MTATKKPQLNSASTHQPKGPVSSTNPDHIRWRAVIVGSVLALLICMITPCNNAYRQGTPLGGGHFPLAPFYLFVWMMFAAALLRRIFRRYNLITGKELLVMWALMVLLSGIAWTGLARTFFINITAPFRFATVENRWAEVLHPLLPKAWYPASPEAVSSFYNGLEGGRDMSWFAVLKHIPWESWIGPLLAWAGFVFLCYFVMICIISLLSKQGIQNERMNFPLLRVPLLMQRAFDSNEFGEFVTNRYLLVGLSIPFFLHLINGLSFYHPSIPSIPTVVLAGKYFPSQGLFSGFDKLRIYIYPAFIGFAFLASKQISFSFWFFYILGALLIGALNFVGVSIPAADLGITFGPTISRPEETQMIGAYIVFFLFLAWLARYHFRDMIGKGFRLEKDPVSEQHCISTRFAFWGTAAGGFGIVLWCHYFGIPFFFSFLVVGVFFMFMLVATRVICQGGIAYFTLTAAPMDCLMVFFGPKAFTHAGLLVSGVIQKMLFLDLRESLMPSLLHARKISDGIANYTWVYIAILVVLVAGV
ncbi:MAG: hypothetical protein P8Y38_01040, partial [Deltaproteobacteria bacterium]